jgi:hypothetical protein
VEQVIHAMPFLDNPQAKGKRAEEQPKLPNQAGCLINVASAHTLRFIDTNQMHVTVYCWLPGHIQ